jgi:transmembrane sensor
MPNDPAPPLQPDAPIDWETLARYLAGECSDDESEHIARWLSEHPADAQLLASLDKAMATLALRDTADLDVESALERVRARRDAPRQPVAATDLRVLPLHRKPAPPWRFVAALAAAAVVIIAARAVLQRKVGASGSASVTSARTYASAVGKRDSLTLPDGGRIILGPASRLTVAAGYGQPTREVELHGEAYFDVGHDTTHPFVVHVGDATVRDIGTSFAVRGDSGLRVQVVVTSGIVRLQRAIGRDDGATLAAGDVGVLQPGGPVTAEHGASTAPYLAWMRDSLVFRDAPVPQVSAELRRWYGVTLDVRDSALARRHLTMTFAGDPIDRVLRVIGLTLGADVERRGDTAFVRPSPRRVPSQ